MIGAATIGSNPLPFKLAEGAINALSSLAAVAFWELIRPRDKTRDTHHQPHSPPARGPSASLRRDGTNGKVHKISTSRYLVAYYPQTVPIARPFIINAGILRNQEGDASKQMEDFDVPPEGVDVSIELHVSKDLFIEGKGVDVLHVLPDQDPNLAGFRISAQTRGSHSVKLIAFLGARELGQLDFSITGDDASTGSDRSEAKVPAQPLNSPGLDSEATITVASDERNKSYRILWHSKAAVFQPQEALDATGVSTAVEKIVERVQEIVRGDSRITTDGMNNRLEGLGRSLWDDIVPEKIRQHYAEEYRRYKSISVRSNGDPIPWELLFPHQAPARPKDPTWALGFWGEKVNLWRWPLGDVRRSSLNLELATLVLPPDCPKQASEEVEEIRFLLEARGVSVKVLRTKRELLTVLDAGRVNLIHIASHNTFDEHTSKLSLDEDLELIDLVPLHKHFPEVPLLVFVNACRSEAKRANVMKLQGWAEQFIKCGASVFIGTLWEVRDGSARIFATKFYQKICESARGICGPLGLAREETRKIGNDPTWLAYCVYGDIETAVTLPIRS